MVEREDILERLREKPWAAVVGAFRPGSLFTGIRLCFNLLCCTRVFGTALNALTKLKFLTERFIFHARERLRDKRLLLKADASVVRLGFWSVVCSFLLVAGLHWVSLSVTTPRAIAYFFDALHPKQGNAPAGLDGTTYITLLTTVAGITGVFLALYFTTLTVVATSYSEPHHREIRNLIIEEAISRGYLALSAHLGAVCLFGLGFLAIGFTPNLLLMAYVLLIAGVVIFSFFLVGRHIFQFLDPRILVATPVAGFLKWQRNATILGSRWKLPSFQNFFRRQALGELHKIECLIEFALSQPARREVVRDLCVRLLDLMQRNALESRRIPSLSLWFPRTRIFQEWGFTSGIQSDIALRTGTLPQPEEVPDYLFVSRAISLMVRRSVEELLRRKDYLEVSSIVVQVYRVLGKLGESLALEEAQSLLGEIQGVLFSADSGLPVVEKNDRLQAMSMASVYGTCLLNLGISASQTLESLSVDEILGASHDLESRPVRGLYKHGHPREVLRHLEEFHKQLLFEQDTEGRIRSSDWFLKEHVARRYADYIWNISERFTLWVNEYHIEPLQALLKAGTTWTTPELLRASIEVTKKIGFRVTALAELHRKLAACAVTKEDWRVVDYTLLEKKLRDVEVQLIRNVAQIAPTLANAINVGEIPDYLGLFKTYLGDAIVSKMAVQDSAEFESLFAGVFVATLAVVERHIVREDSHFLKPNRTAALDTALDLVDLSGLAFLFSELHGSSFYHTVTKKWDDYFQTCKDGKLAIEFFYLAINMALQLPIASPSAQGRWNWKRAFIGAMAKAGFNIEGRFSRWEGEEKARKEHKSPVIQSIYPHMGMTFEHPYDYFAAFYLSNRPEAAGIELPAKARQCKASVDQEVRRRKGKAES